MTVLPANRDLPSLLAAARLVITVNSTVAFDAMTLAISEFPKGRKYLISLSFRGKASVRPAQVGGFDVNIVIHGSTAVRGRGDLVAYRWALWKLTAPWTHRTRPPHLGKRCAFSTSSTGPFPSNHSRKTPKGPKIALGNPDRPMTLGIPALTVSLPNNLSPLVKAGVMVGLAADEPIAPVIRELLYDEARRSALDDAIHAFVTRYDLRADGRAVERTADAIMNLLNR